MAERPTRPTVPAAPDRQQPSTFAARADAMVAFLQTLVTYMEAAQSYTDQRAGDADAAVLAAGGFGTLNLANFAGKAIGVNTGGNMLTGITFQDLDKATEDEAEGGTDNDAYMTALRVKQLAEALFPSNNGWVKITEKTASDDSELVFSGDDFNDSLYVDYQFIMRNILPAADGRQFRLYPSDDNGANNTNIKSESFGRTNSSWDSQGYVTLSSDAGTIDGVGMSTDEPGLSGVLHFFNFHEDKGAIMVAQIAFVDSTGKIARPINGVAALQQPSVDGPLNHIRFVMNTGNISSGSITLMGLRR